MSDSSKPLSENGPEDSPPAESGSRLEGRENQAVEEPLKATGASEGQSETSQLQEELHKANDRALRAQADLDNYRKRMQREIDDGRRYANVPLIRDLLPIIDNLERAISAAEKTEENSGLLTGVEMVVSHFISTLQRHHCEKINTEGVLFDPNLHEAISQQYSDQHPENTVLHEALLGYMIHDRVVRPSQVVVSTTQPPGGSEQVSPEAEENEKTEE